MGWRKCMDIDIMSVMAGTYLAMERMDKQKGGRGGLIVNTASVAGIGFGNKEKELADANSYFVAKHGVVALTRSLSNPDLEAATGVKLKCICPAFADTNIIRDGMTEPEEIRGKIIKKLGGLMTPEYVAEGFHRLIVDCGSGSALMVIKDVPYFTYPDLSVPLVIILGIGAKVFGMLGIRVFHWQHQAVYTLLLLLLAHLVLGVILSIIL